MSHPQRQIMISLLKPFYPTIPMQTISERWFLSCVSSTTFNMHWPNDMECPILAIFKIYFTSWSSSCNVTTPCLLFLPIVVPITWSHKLLTCMACILKDVLTWHPSSMVARVAFRSWSYQFMYILCAHLLSPSNVMMCSLCARWISQQWPQLMWLSRLNFNSLVGITPLQTPYARPLWL